MKEGSAEKERRRGRHGEVLYDGRTWEILCSPLIHPLIQVQWAFPVVGRTNRCGDDSPTV
jgi:hypothetical protein